MADKKDIDRQAVENDYYSGMQYKDLAEKYDVSINTIKSWKLRYGWDRKNHEKCAHKKDKRVHTKKSDDQAYIADAGQVGARPDTAEEQALIEPLTEKERLFCETYVRNFNATQAAVKAGYSVDTAYAIGYENLKKPHIRNYVNYLKELKREAIGLTVGDLVERHLRLAFSDITDFVDFGVSMQPVMTMHGPLMVKDPVTGEKEPVLKPVNTMQFKSSFEVDGGIISEISVGRDGAKVKLEDRQKHLDWLERYFEWNPDSKYKREFDEKRLAIEREKLDLAKKELAMKNPQEPTEVEDDGFIKALEGKAPEVWGDKDREKK